MLGDVFFTVLRMSAGAAVVVPVVMLLRLVLKNMPKIWSYGLWLLVLVRLLCPVLPEISVPAVSEFDASVFAWETYTRQTEASEIFDGPGDAPMESAYVDPENIIQAAPSQPYESGKAPMSLQTLLVLLWLTGAAAVLAWGGVSMGKLRRKLRAAVPLEEGVYAADHIDTSFVTGLICPKIYLPSDLPEEWGASILLHERHHIRRLDPVVKFLYFLALAVHWFNPLVWAAYRLMALDMEMSCDEAVTQQMDSEDRTEYAQALLCLATGRRSLLSPLSFGEGDTGKRIKNILNYKKPALWLTALAVLLCLAASLLILVEPAEYNSARLEYPGFSWGDSPEAVMAALRDMGNSRRILVESTWEAGDTYETGGYSVQIADVEMFGQTASSAVFRFVEYSWNPGQRMLEQIVLYYPDGYEGGAANLEALEAEITDMFGDPIEETVQRSWYPGYKGIHEERNPVNPGLTIWKSEETALDVLTEEEVKAIYDHMVHAYAEDDTVEWLPTLEEFRPVLEVPVASIRLRETYFSLMGANRELTPELREQGATDYVLTLSGQSYLGHLDAAKTAMEP